MTQKLTKGAKFGDYTVVRLLGKGGMGEVWLLQNATGGQLAAKILTGEADHESRKRFLREAELALGVKHPNLVEVFDVGEDPDTGLCYILMEYVPGGTLADVIKDIGPLPIEDAVAVVQAIALVLELAREKGIVHRDIKPANIMFGADGTPKLADLGIARGGVGGTDTTTVTQTGMMIGTPAYMAPEQMLDAHSVDTRADIYSLGVVFFEMLTGERPNKDDTIVQLMAKAVKGEPLPDVRTLRPEVSASLAQLLSMMVVPSVELRIAAPKLISSALDKIERGGTLEDPSENERRLAERRRRRRKRRLVFALALSTAALVGLSGIAVGIWWLTREGAQPAPRTVSVVERGLPPPARVEPVVKKAFPSASRVEPVVKKAPLPASQTDGDKKSKVDVADKDKYVRKPWPKYFPKTYATKVGEYTWRYAIVENDCAIVTAGGCDGKHGDKTPAISPLPIGQVVVPQVLDGHKVIAIGDRAFNDCVDITEIVIPEGVQEICHQPFVCCKELRSVQLPKSLRYVATGAFYGCNSLNTINLRQCHDVGLFYQGFTFKRFECDDDNPYLSVDADGVLYDKRKTTLVQCPVMKTSMRIPETVTAFRPWAFDNCSRLRSMRIPEGISVLPQGLFNGCSHLGKVIVPASVVKFEKTPFRHCECLGKLVFAGNAPAAVQRSEALFEDAPADLQVIVKERSTGWKTPESAELPNLWPADAGSAGRPIRAVSADELAKLMAENSEEESSSEVQTKKELPKPKAAVRRESPYRRVRVAELKPKAQAQLKEIGSWRSAGERRGTLVFGTLKIDGKPSGAGVTSWSCLLDDGWFSADVFPNGRPDRHSAGGHLLFAKHGYEPVEIDLSAEASREWSDAEAYDLGVVKMMRLSAERQCTLSAIVKLPSGVSEGELVLTLDNRGPCGSHWGYRGGQRPSLKVLTRRFCSDEEIKIDGCSPTDYRVEIHADGCVAFHKQIDMSDASARNLKIVSLQRVKRATFALRPFADGEWKVVSVLADNVQDLRPEGRTGRHSLRLDPYQRAKGLSVSSFHVPATFDDYGALTTNLFDRQMQNGSLAAPVPLTARLGRVDFFPGRIYRFRCSHIPNDTLIAFLDYREEPPKGMPSDSDRRNKAVFTDAEIAAMRKASPDKAVRETFARLFPGWTVTGGNQKPFGGGEWAYVGYFKRYCGRSNVCNVFPKSQEGICISRYVTLPMESPELNLSVCCPAAASIGGGFTVGVSVNDSQFETFDVHDATWQDRNIWLDKWAGKRVKIDVRMYPRRGTKFWEACWSKIEVGQSQ